MTAELSVTYNRDKVITSTRLKIGLHLDEEQLRDQVGTSMRGASKTLQVGLAQVVEHYHQQLGRYRE